MKYSLTIQTEPAFRAKDVVTEVRRVNPSSEAEASNGAVCISTSCWTSLEFESLHVNEAIARLENTAPVTLVEDLRYDVSKLELFAWTNGTDRQWFDYFTPGPRGVFREYHSKDPNGAEPLFTAQSAANAILKNA